MPPRFNEVICRKVLRAAYAIADGQQECSVASSSVALFMGIPCKNAAQVLHDLNRRQMLVHIGTGGTDAHFWLTPEGVWQVEQGFPHF